MNLSTHWLGSLKTIFFVAYSVLFCCIVGFHFYAERFFMGFGFTVTYGYGLFVIMRMTAKLQQASFDDEFLYVMLGKQEIVIPLENIESVEIETLGGTYKVNLYHAEQLGKEFYFKTSMLYPLNYKRKDALVNVLRKKIDVTKSKRQTFPVNALHS